MSTDSFYAGKVVLVTGGCGSIGRAIVDRLLACGVRQVRIYDSSENLLFQTYRRYADPSRVQGPVLHSASSDSQIHLITGDVRDKDQLRLVMHGVDYVFHAAALKHVPNCEYNPAEAVKTNVIGTQNVIEAAHERGVSRMVCISTDKAINPVNTLGASKMLMEKLALSPVLDYVSTRYACVRFGNVLDSDGSVLPVFRSQIEHGLPVTITHPEMKRFFMEISDAVKLVLAAGAQMRGREIFVLKMSAMRIIDLAEVLIEELAPLYGHRPADIPIQVIGSRPGERLNESLLTEEEIPFTSERDDMYVVQPPLMPPHLAEREAHGRPVPAGIDTATVPMLSKEEIRALLRQNHLLDRRQVKGRGQMKTPTSAG